MTDETQQALEELQETVAWIDFGILCSLTYDGIMPPLVEECCYSFDAWIQNGKPKFPQGVS